MTEPAAGLGPVRVTVTVAVDPATAFVVFTEEIGWSRLAGWFEGHVEHGRNE